MNFLFTTSSRLALGSTQPSIQWVPGVLSPGVKRPVREADHSPPTSAARSRKCGSMHPLPHTSYRDFTRHRLLWAEHRLVVQTVQTTALCGGYWSAGRLLKLWFSSGTTAPSEILPISLLPSDHTIPRYAVLLGTLNEPVDIAILILFRRLFSDAVSTTQVILFYCIEVRKGKVVPGLN
jgi:hypothetical protein